MISCDARWCIWVRGVFHWMCSSAGPVCHREGVWHYPRWTEAWTASSSLPQSSECPVPPPRHHQPSWSVCVVWTPWMETGVTGVFALLRSTMSSFVFVTLSCRWFSSHQVTKLSTTVLYSFSSPFLMQPTIAESSENFWRWQDSVQ